MAHYLSDKVYHQSKDGQLTQERVVRIGLYKAIGILVGAILASAGASIWGTLAVANTIPFRVDAIEKDVASFEKKFMPLDLSMEKWKNNDGSHQKIEKQLDNIENKIDEIRGVIK